MKKTLRLFAIPMLAVFALLATSYQPRRSAAAPITCGPIVYGHTADGQMPTVACPQDGLPALDKTCHIYSSADVCPIDGQPVFYARSTASF
jgi:hypothetical protein